MRFSLSKLFLFYVALVALGAVVLLSAVVLITDASFYWRQAAALRESLTDENKERVREVCGNAMRVIDVIRSEASREFHEDLEMDASRSFDIAAALYTQNSRWLDKADLVQVLGETILSGVPCATDARFFWIDETGVMHSRSQFDERPVAGPAPPGLAIGHLAEKTPFEVDFSPRPGVASERSLVYALQFAEMGWTVGALAPLRAEERQTQQKVIAGIESIRFGNKGYVFAGQWDGLSLAGPGKGQNMWDAADPDGVKIVQELVSAAQNGGGFVYYILDRPEGGGKVPKISYALPINDWKWYIGTGMHIDDIDKKVAAAHADLWRDMSRNVSIGLSICGVIILAAIAGSMVLAKRLDREAGLFSSFFEQAADNALAYLDVNRFRISEFVSIGEAANRMLEERRRAESELRESEERFAKAFLASPDSVMISRFDDSTFLAANEQFYRQTGYTEAEIIGHRAIELFWGDPETRSEYARLLETTGEVNELPMSFRRKDGTLGSYLLSARSIELHGEACIIAISRDVTAQKQAEEERAHLEQQLRQAQKMEAVGQLAGGVAHDFNNLLQAISGYTSLSQAELPADHPAQEYLQQVDRAGERAAALVRQLLAFGRREMARPRPLDLNELVSGFMKMVGRVIGESIEVRFQSGVGLSHVFADPGQLEQVALNLCLNARDAMPNGGVLTIETAQVALDSAFCKEHLWAREGEFVVLRVSDTGVGMTPEVIEHVFEPFFTTKGVGEGSGLGLSMVYGIVKQNDGLIDIQSLPGAGATFHVYLPKVEPEATGQPELLPEAGLPGGSETILLAEDEGMVRDFACRVLERAGYRVLSACDGEEAVDLFRRHTLEIDLSVLDVVMPKKSGPAVLERMRSERPDLPVLFCTGYGQAHLAPQVLEADGAELLCKPYTQAELLGRVRVMLDRFA